MKKIVSLFIFIGFVLNLYALSMQDEVLMPNEAFKPSAVLKNGKINIDIKLGDKIYIYKDKLKFSIIEPKKISLDNDLRLPKPIRYHDFIVYIDDFNYNIPLSLIKSKLGNKIDKFKLRVEFQGCSKLGLCYSPMKKDFEFDLKNISSNVANKTSNFKNIKNKPTVAKWNLSNSETRKYNISHIKQNKSISKEKSIADTLSKSSFLVVLATFYGFGLLLSLTPCIFPMIPILSSIIVSQSKESMNAKRGFVLSLVYVLSMSVAYTIAGVLAGLFGANIQIWLQNPWVIGVFSAIFVALAFSMFGYYELQLPASFQSKINKTSEKAQGKGFVSVAIMGFLSALIVGPCVAAPLAGALMYIGQSGDALLGGTALFVMSLGMGMPLLLIGLGAGRFMPKPGGWMQNVSKVFGVVMLAVAIYILSRVIPDMLTMILWAFLFMGSSIYLKVLEPLKDNAKGIERLIKVIGLIFLIYGIMLFVGAYMGSKNPLDPLEGFKSRVYISSRSNQDKQSQNYFETVKNIQELNDLIANAKKPVMVDFSAKWCVSCKELESNTFENEKVKKILQSFKLIRVDVTKNTKEDKELMKKYQVFGPPVILFFDKKHNLLNEKKIVGYIEPKKFIEHLKGIL